MPIRRPLTGRSLTGLLLVALAFVASGSPVAAADPTPPAPSGVRPVPQRSLGDPSGRLGGQLVRLVRAAESGALDAGAFRGFEVASSSFGAGVAVSLVLAPTGGEEALQALLAQGGRVANRAGDRVEAYLSPAALASLGSLTGISRASAIIRPVPLATTGIGSVGEGVALHRADVWQAAGVTGAGVKVGIIDGGFVGLTARLGRELPDTIYARCYREIGLYASTAKSCEAYTEHGTAVAETISDMAPGASLYLADPLSQQDLESTVAWMTSNGVTVINVSLGFAFEGPGDGTSPTHSIYSVVDQAVRGGALWVNAAGNSGEDGWTGTWKDADHNNMLEFSGTDEGNSMALGAGESIVVSLRWNDTWGASGNDYNLYVYGPTGSTPVAASEDPQTGHGNPAESLSFTPSSSGVYRIAVQRTRGTTASKLQLLVLTSQDAPLQYRVAANTLPSPADSANPGMLTVGAVAFDQPDAIEAYSSRGPTIDNRVKPDLVAADCTSTSLINPFCGTSESAPYTTGAAALVRAAKPGLTPAQVAEWLRSRAVPLGSPTPNSTFGWGRLDLGTPPAPPAPSSLTFLVQPALAIAQLPLSQAPAVQIRDQDGAVIATGAGSTASVRLSLGANPGAGTLTCDGGLTRDAVGGTATFTGCTISAEAPGVTLIAQSGALLPVTSAAFDVLPMGSAPAPAVDVSASAAAIAWGTAVSLRAQLSAAAGSPLPSSLSGRAISFETSTDGTTWRGVGTAVTDASALATFSYRPVTNLYYRATFAGAPDLGGASGGPTRVTVRQTINVRPTNRGLTRVVARNQTITFTALVRPARSDVPPGAVTFEVYRQVGSVWRRVVSQLAQPDAGGTASLAVTFSSIGRWYVRAMARPTPVNANSVWTSPEFFQVR